MIHASRFWEQLGSLYTEAQVAEPAVQLPVVVVASLPLPDPSQVWQRLREIPPECKSVTVDHVVAEEWVLWGLIVLVGGKRARSPWEAANYLFNPINEGDHR